MMTWAGRIFLALFIAISSPAGLSLANDKKLVIAHRGASGYLPEHTLVAKAFAYAQGADYLEQDVVLTSDGVPIILHDIHLDTVSNVTSVFPDRKRDDGHYYVIDFTLSEIKSLSVHERMRKGSDTAVFSKRFPVGKSSFSIPTLAEEIELVIGLNHSTGRNVGIFPEIKNPKFHLDNGFDLSKIVVDMLASYSEKTPDLKFIVQSFDWNETKRIRTDLGYQGKLVQLLGENRWRLAEGTDFDHLKTAEGLKEIATIADGIGPWINQMVTGKNGQGKAQFTDLARNAKAVGLVIYPYTARADALPKWANGFDDLLQVVLDEGGADGIFTDFTDKAVQFLHR